MLCSAAGTKSPAAVRNWARIGGKDKKNLRTEEIKKPVHGGDKKNMRTERKFSVTAHFSTTGRAVHGAHGEHDG
jgi:hypothetical protein